MSRTVCVHAVIAFHGNKRVFGAHQKHALILISRFAQNDMEQSCGISQTLSQFAISSTAYHQKPPKDLHGKKRKPKILDKEATLQKYQIMISFFGRSSLSDRWLTRCDVLTQWNSESVNNHFIPGHQPEMPDSVKFLLRDATYLGFHTDCLLKSID